jgi:hypothetical protein
VSSEHPYLTYLETLDRHRHQLTAALRADLVDWEAWEAWNRRIVQTGALTAPDTRTGRLGEQCLLESRVHQLPALTAVESLREDVRPFVFARLKELQTAHEALVKVLVKTAEERGAIDTDPIARHAEQIGTARREWANLSEWLARAGNNVPEVPPPLAALPTNMTPLLLQAVFASAAAAQPPASSQPSASPPDDERAGQEEAASGSAAPGPPAGDSEPSDRQRDILQVLFQQSAFDIDHRMTTEEIVDAVCGPGRGSPDSFKRPVKDLKDRGLVETKYGSRGGVWLTDAGRAYIKQIRNL